MVPVTCTPYRVQNAQALVLLERTREPRHGGDPRYTSMKFSTMTFQLNGSSLRCVSTETEIAEVPASKEPLKAASRESAASSLKLMKTKPSQTWYLCLGVALGLFEVRCSPHLGRSDKSTFQSYIHQWSGSGTSSRCRELPAAVRSTDLSVAHLAQLCTWPDAGRRRTRTRTEFSRSHTTMSGSPNTVIV